MLVAPPCAFDMTDDRGISLEQEASGDPLKNVFLDDKKRRVCLPNRSHLNSTVD